MNDPMTPHFIIIGAQKAGSSSLQHYLNAHPEVSLIPQEANVLQDPFYSEAAVNDFLRRFPGDAADKVRGIKRPNYLNSARGAGPHRTPLLPTRSCSSRSATRSSASSPPTFTTCSTA